MDRGYFTLATQAFHSGDTPSSLDGFHGLFRSKAVDEGRGIPMTPWKCQKTAILD
jgi:hypothetical protein